MDVSNGTGEGTDYRTGYGTTKESTWTHWKHLLDKQVLQCADPQAPWSICFRLKSGKTLIAYFDQPMESVTLVKSGNSYKISAIKKRVEKPVKKPANKPVAPAKTAKKNAA